MEESLPPSCRLCLTAFRDQSEDLLDIFHDVEADFSLKIRDCTGVFFSREDDSFPATICTNCAETVHFIAEFRELCRRSEEQYEGLREGRFDPARWEAYRHHVGELRRLLPTEEGEEDPEENYFKPMVAVKQEEEEGEMFEWAEAGDVQVKQEVDYDEGENNVEEEEDDVPRRKKIKVEPVVDQMGLAKAIHEHPVLWDSGHKGFHDADKRERAWTKLASTTELDKAQLKQEFNRLHDIYRRKHCSSEASGDELYQLLESMFSTRKESKLRGSVAGCSTNEEDSTDERLSLAQVLYEHEMIWNRSHEEFDKPTKWIKVANQLGITVHELKHQWKCLRDVYHARKRRLLLGTSNPNNPRLHEPLYVLLEKMMIGNVQRRSRLLTNKEENKTLSVDEQIKIAEAIYAKEIIWNRTHSHHNNVADRDCALEELAVELNMPANELRQQWKKMHDFYRARCLYVMEGKLALDDPKLQEPLYLLLHKMFGEGQPNQQGKRPRRPRAIIDAEFRLSIVGAVHAQQILWNKTHPDFEDNEKRDITWQQVADQLSITIVELKNQWKLLRDLYRSRIRRLPSGRFSPNHPLLRQKLFRLLNEMLRGNMNVGQRSKAKFKQALPRRKGSEKKDDDEEESEADGGEEFSEEQNKVVSLKKWGKPFESKEMRARLAEEISKHEMLWNMNHVDYSRGSLRGKVWTEIAKVFGVDRGHAIAAWSRATHRHRRLLEFNGSVAPELLEQDPLHRMMHEVVYKTVKGVPSADPAKNVWPPKRRFTGKKSYSDEGCFKVIQNGTTHYLRVCELCGKNVERSDFEYHMNRHNGLTPYACSYEGCDKRYASKITRDRHEVLVHTSDAERFECEQCGEKFKYRSKLEYHHAMNHQSLNVPCSICGKDLKHRNALRNHMLKVHKQSGFGCPTCGRVLQTRFSLNVHMRIHTNEKPFPCVLCGQCYRLKVLLKTHLAKVHNVAIEELEGPGPSGSGK